MSEKVFLNLQDMAKRLNLSINSFRKTVRERSVPHLRLSSRIWRFDADKVVAFLETTETPTEKQAQGKGKAKSYRGNRFAKDIGLG